MADALGYAVKWRGGVLDVRTVSPTERAAKVNGLTLAGVIVLRVHDDQHVEQLWERFAAEVEAQVVPVHITEKAHAGA